MDWVLQAVGLVGVAAFSYLIYYLWFVPLEYARRLEEVGFKWRKNDRRIDKETIQQLRKARKVGEVPPPYPNGWFVLAESRNVRPGDIIQVSLLGRQFAVFRSTTDKAVSVTDAHCPHLGASLAAGGTVQGDCIRCPFHLWQFSGKTGNIVDIPNSDKLPTTKARLKVWPSLERNQTIFLWHHAEGIDPTYEPDLLPEVDESEWVYQGKNAYEVACHIQEIPENGADVAHLAAIHSESFMAGGEPMDGLLAKLASWTWHEWTISWAPCSEDEADKRSHVARTKLNQKATVMGVFNLLEMHVVGDQIGPALVHLHFEVKHLGWRGVMIQYTQPVEPMLQKLVHCFYTERRWIPPLAKIALKGEGNLVERDIAVWNNKMYLHQPLLAVKEDRLLKRYRKWYSQFYSENSVSFREATRAAPSLDW